MELMDIMIGNSIYISTALDQDQKLVVYLILAVQT